LSKIVSEQNIDEILKEIGYNDSPLRREVKQAFAKWILQYIKAYVKGTVYDREIGALNELLEDLGK